MSLEASAWAWKQPVRGTKKLVLLALADYADDEGEAWPALGRITERCGVTRSSVHDSLRALEAEGFLTRIERFALSGRQRSNRYRLALGGSGPPDPQGVRPAVPQEPSDEPPPAVDEESRSNERPKKPRDRVWGHYVAVMDPRYKKLDDESGRLIDTALRVASEDECCRAIDGCAASTFHMGDNDRGRKYNQISQILKSKHRKHTTRERIDYFIDLAAKSEHESQLPSADAVIVAQAKRKVLDAHEFPRDATVVRRGEEAETWLAQHGWRVTRDERGRPTFVRAEP